SHHAHAIGEKREQRANQWIEGREEDLVEDQPGHRIKQGKIVPFQNRADCTGCRDPMHRPVFHHAFLPLLSGGDDAAVSPSLNPVAPIRSICSSYASARTRSRERTSTSPDAE